MPALTNVKKKSIKMENVKSCGTLAFGVREMRNIMGFHTDT
jgi:hypothetical protein